MELTITAEEIREAALTCYSAKEVLKTLFPEAFKNEEDVFLDSYGTTDGAFHSSALNPDDRIIIRVRTTG